LLAAERASSGSGPHPNLPPGDSVYTQPRLADPEAQVAQRDAGEVAPDSGQVCLGQDPIKGGLEIGANSTGAFLQQFVGGAVQGVADALVEHTDCQGLVGVLCIEDEAQIGETQGTSSLSDLLLEVAPRGPSEDHLLHKRYAFWQKAHVSLDFPLLQAQYGHAF
jgi:hypothetical protein